MQNLQNNFVFITSLAVDDIMNVGDLNDQHNIGNDNNVHSNDSLSQCIEHQGFLL